jgi:3-dehydroquinate synthase
VNVALGPRSYRILIAPGLLDKLGSTCARLFPGGKCAVITDRNVAPLYLDRTLRSLKAAGLAANPVIVPAGETAKNLKVVSHCYDRLADVRLERKSFLVALGGGVVGDLAGFVAATYLRGIAFVQCPTTLLAQVDSSVGGKVGVNLAAGKNLVGAFHQPRLVLCDLDTLASLPEREYRSGLAEVIKYGIIAGRQLFTRLERKLDALLARDSAELAAVVASSCELKADVVAEDETEGGRRAILNYGHTIGHAIEAISRYGKFLHGEAISIGQVAASHISRELAGLPARDVARITQLFTRAGLPVAIKLDNRQRSRLLEAMLLDKKVGGGEIRFVLAKAIGEVVYGQPVSRELIERYI